MTNVVPDVATDATRRVTPSEAYLMVVDDDPDIREVLELALRTYGFNVSTATSGLDCLRQLSERRPSLILVDMMMADMNGWELCERLAKDPTLSSIPLMILTGNSQIHEGDVDGVPILRKPIGLDDLVDAVSQRLATF